MNTNEKRYMAFLLCVFLVIANCFFHIDTQQSDPANTNSSISLESTNQTFNVLDGQNTEATKLAPKNTFSIFSNRKINTGRNNFRFHNNDTICVLGFLILLFFIQQKTLFLNVIGFQSKSELILMFIHKKDGKKRILLTVF